MKKSDLPSPASLKAETKSQLKVLSKELDMDATDALAPASIHGARRRIKRLRSLLRLLRESLGNTQFAMANAQLRTAADALAQQRRAEALVAASQRLGSAKHPHPLLAVAEANRQHHEGASSAPGGLKRARQAVADALAAVSASRLARRSPNAIAESFMGFYRKARKGLGKALETRGAEELHEARKRVIDHLHHLELLRPHLPGLDGKRLKRLNALREALGDLNDLDELQQLASARDAAIGVKDAKVLEKRRRELLEDAEKHFKLLFRDKPKVFVRRIGIGVAGAEAGKPGKAKAKHSQNSRAGVARG